MVSFLNHEIFDFFINPIHQISTFPFRLRWYFIDIFDNISVIKLQITYTTMKKILSCEKKMPSLKFHTLSFTYSHIMQWTVVCFGN